MELKLAVAKNPMNLPQAETDSLLKKIERREVSYLSPDQEGSAFLMYCMGDSLDDIAEKSSTPKSVIYLTAVYYGWAEKGKLVRNAQGAVTPDVMQKMMTNSILAATYISVQKQLADVISGRLDPKDCALIPKNLNGLSQLIEMVNKVNNLMKQNDAAPQTHITAQNVQVVQNHPTSLPSENAQSRIERLKALEASDG